MTLKHTEQVRHCLPCLIHARPQAVSLLLENPLGKTEGKTQNNISVHASASVICEAASRK